MPGGGNTLACWSFCFKKTAMSSRILLLILLMAAGRHAAGQSATTDVILRTDGSEVSGRVVVITPMYMQYVPPASADTLRLAAADVFMVRYANGTREVLHPATPNAAPDLLPGLSDPERTALGRHDANRYYRSGGPFWGSLAASFGTGPLLGLLAPALIAGRPVADNRLGAPRPILLTEPTYGMAYHKEAQRLKRSRVWAGYAVGTGILLVLLASEQ